VVVVLDEAPVLVEPGVLQKLLLVQLLLSAFGRDQSLGALKHHVDEEGSVYEQFVLTELL
jgi:hypothetical protein